MKGERERVRTSKKTWMSSNDIIYPFSSKIKASLYLLLHLILNSEQLEVEGQLFLLLLQSSELLLVGRYLLQEGLVALCGGGEGLGVVHSQSVGH